MAKEPILSAKDVEIQFSVRGDSHFETACLEI